ncbi:phage holin family protein [Nitrosovibrio sp. Nv17]|uniref:phage holin family protein n=1 Tax=Nitrosovibrio sp. Nv17 TaxID=1855339 RepID=UPI000908E4B6|nr:phage holin family protein [Nitrosovibrio sp. Nv17]SFW18084.1 Uncharacterized membrane protein YqjE [Nitrosovibrio sp. Nv17]
MFESLQKARYLAGMALERVDDYLQLVRISAEIQRQELKRRIVGFLIMGMLVLLALIFLGLAIVVTFWDTPYRTISAWAVAAVYGLGAVVAYLVLNDGSIAKPASPFETLRDELQQDIKLMKDVG